MSRVTNADELRLTLETVYPRPGWKARNIDALAGRVIDLIDYPDLKAFVEWDWDTGIVSAYFDGQLIFDDYDDPSNDMVREAAFRIVEDAAAASLRPASPPGIEGQES